MEFTGPMHGTPVNVLFVVLGEGKGYFDPFPFGGDLREVTPAVS